MNASGAILGAGLSAGVLLYLAHAHGQTSVSSSGSMRQTSIDGRSYTVFSLGGGAYQVISNSNPNVWIQFGQVGIDDHDDGGVPAELLQLQADMQLFPKDLFT